MEADRRAARITAIIIILLFPSLMYAASLVPCEGPNCNFASFMQLIKNVMKFLLTIAVPIFAVLFSWAGFLMITAAGKEGQITKAKGMMTTAFIGFGIALGAYLIVNLLTNVFLEGSPDARDVLQSKSDTIYETV